jgi:hypothetical protein
MGYKPPKILDRKVAAVRADASQIKDPDTFADRLRERIAPCTPAAGLNAAGAIDPGQLRSMVASGLCGT